MAGITLAQLAQLETDPMAKYLQMRILRDAQVMEKLPFDNVSSLSVRAMVPTVLPTAGSWRSLNEGYSSAEDGQFGERWETLYGFGGDITFDRVLDSLTNTIKDPVQAQIELKLKSAAMTWNDTLINGDHATDPKSFEGLKKRVAAMPSSQTIYFTANTTDAPLDPCASAANARRFLNTIDDSWMYCNGGKPSVILCNRDFIRGFRRAMLFNQVSGNFLDVTKDSFDRQFISYNGATMIDMGLKKDQSTEIISNTETAGDAGADSMSVYLVAFNTEEGVHGIQLNPLKVYDPLNGGEMESKPAKMRRFDWWNGIASFGQYGIVRLRNLSNLAGFTQ